jgi:hypothetical protein
MARTKILLARVTDLPPICVCCGQPATRVRQQEFRLDGVLSAATLAASVLAGGLAWTERGITLTLPVCEYHRRRGRQSTRTLIWGMALTGGLGAAAYLSSVFDSPASNYLAVAAMFTFIAALVVGMHEVDDGLKVTSLTTDSMTLAGIHRAFAEALRRQSDPTEPVAAPDPAA